MRQDSPFFMMIKCYTDADHYEKRRIFYETCFGNRK